MIAATTRRIIAAAALLLSLSLSLIAQAQIAPGTGAGTRTFEAPPATRAPSRLDIAIPDASAMLQKLAGWVTRFRVSGSTVVSETELTDVLKPWTGRELSATDLSVALNAFRACLRQHGLYAADAFFPEQTVIDGVVQVIVLEGRLGSLNLDMKPDARLRHSTVEKHLARLPPDSLIRCGTLDTTLLLLNDLPGVQVTPSLTPADAQGRADLRVRIDDEPMASGYLQIDNHELRELGEYRTTGALRLRNPLGIGDLATAQFTQTHTNGRMLGALSYSLPLGGRGTRVGARIATHQYRLGGDFEALLANGGVFLVNPNGILFSSGARVDTAAFTATTGSLANAAFLAGNITPTGGASTVGFDGVLNFDGNFSIRESGIAGDSNLSFVGNTEIISGGTINLQGLIGTPPGNTFTIGAPTVNVNVGGANLSLPLGKSLLLDAPLTLSVPEGASQGNIIMVNAGGSTLNSTSSNANIGTGATNVTTTNFGFITVGKGAFNLNGGSQLENNGAISITASNLPTAPVAVARVPIVRNPTFSGGAIANRSNGLPPAVASTLASTRIPTVSVNLQKREPVF